MQLSRGLYSASAALLPVRLTQIDEWIDLLRTLIICPALIIPCKSNKFLSIFPTAGKKVFTEENNLFLIVEDLGGSCSS